MKGFKQVQRKAKRGRWATYDPNSVRVVHGKEAGKSKIRIHLGEQVMRSAQYRVGDVMDIEYSSEEPRMGLIRKLPAGADDGWSLCSPEGTTKWRGKYKRSYIAFVPSADELITFFPNGTASYTAKNVTITDEGILFNIG